MIRSKIVIKTLKTRVSSPRLIGFVVAWEVGAILMLPTFGWWAYELGRWEARDGRCLDHWIQGYARGWDEAVTQHEGWR